MPAALTVFRLLRLPLLAMLMLAATAAAAAKDCSLCGRTIQGQYAVFKHPSGRSLNVCRSCSASAPKCALCTIPYKKGSPSAPLCPDCRRTARTCDVCRQLITTGYNEYRLPGGANRAVCERCEHAAARCSACRVPQRPDWLKPFPNGQQWCRTCLESARVCESCRNPIQGRYFTLQFQQGAWCADCYQNHEKCHFCSRPMATISANLPDGRKICRECFATGLRGEVRARAIAATITPTMQSLLGRPPAPVPIRIVDADELRAVFAPQRQAPRAAAPGKPEPLMELGAFSQTGERREILLLDFLPEDMAWETLAHEMAHAWQAQHFPDVEDWDVVEGFAQWMADRVCDRHGRRNGLEKLRGRADRYGRAYRQFAAIEARDGTDGVLQALRLGRIPGEFRAIE